MDTKLKNTAKTIFILSVISVCIIAGLAFDIAQTVTISDLFTSKKYCESETHKKEIASDLNNLIKQQEENRGRAGSGTYEGTFDDLGIKFYNKNVPVNLKEAKYTYFFAHYNSYYTNSSFRADTYGQYEVFNDLYTTLKNNGSGLLSENSQYYDTEPSFLFYQEDITKNRNTYIIRHQDIVSYGNYINHAISFNDLSDYNKSLTDILVIISYPDRYISNMENGWYKLHIVADILAVVLILAVFYIILYITARYRYHSNGNNCGYLKNTPKCWDLIIVLMSVAIFKLLSEKSLFLFFLIPAFILMLYLCYELPALLYAVKHKTLFSSSFAAKIARLIKRNKSKIYSALKKLTVLKKPLIWAFDIITGRRFNIYGASIVEKFLFRYIALLLVITAALWIAYALCYKVVLTNSAILVIIVYIAIFIFYHYHAQKLLSSFNVIEQQIKKMYSGCYQIDADACKGTAFEKDIDMLAQIGAIFEKNMEDKVKMERTKVELVTNVSHDLKTPLTSIISYIDLLNRDESLPSEAKDYVNILSKKADRLKHIVNDVFELAMTTSGEIKVDNAVLNLNKLIIQTTADLGDKFKTAGMDVRVKTADTDVFISSDGDRIYRIMQNLIDNALKFSLKGTRIYIQEITAGEKATVKVTNTANYEMDFTKEDVMERFFRGDKSRNSEGNGLGLSIAQGFTIACGGTFDIDIDGDQFNAMITFPVIPETVADELRKAANNA